MVLWQILKPVKERVYGMVLLIAGGLSQEVFAESHLEAARRALKVGSMADVRQHYSAIGPQDPEWTQRIEDQIIFQLGNKDPLEAWRLTEVARSMGLPIKELSYLRSLAAVEWGSCPFYIETNHPIWNVLIKAHIIRFASRFREEEEGISSNEALPSGNLPHQISAFQIHYLSAVPKARLLKGKSCTEILEEDEAYHQTALRHEFKTLKQWFDLSQKNPRDTIDMEGAVSVLLRLSELASIEKDSPLGLSVLQYFHKMSVSRWLQLSDTERRYLYQKLMDIGLFSSKPVSPKTPEGDLIEKLILNSHEPQASLWLALLDTGQWSQEKLLSLVDHLLGLPVVEGRPTLLQWKLYGAYLSGDREQAIGLIRRLLIQGEAEGDESVENFSLNVAHAIFSEYRFDQAILAAIQNSVPVPYWNRLYRLLAMDHALRGDKHHYVLLENVLLDRGKAGSMVLPQKEKKLLTSLVNRDLRSYRKAVQEWAGMRRLNHSFLQFLVVLGQRVLALNNDERQVLKPFFSEIEMQLRAAISRGEGDPRILEFAGIFGEGENSRYGEGRDFARHGTQLIGVIDLTQVGGFSWAKPFKAPRSLPLYPLLVVPNGVGQEGWRIK